MSAAATPSILSPTSHSIRRDIADVRSMTPTRRYTPIEWGAFVAAAAVTALGATMIIAWLAGLTDLLRFANPGPTLRFNTAVLFVLCGFAMLCSMERRFRAAIAISIVAVSFAALCAASSLSLIDADVDKLLFHPSAELTAQVGTGRTALGTSLCAMLLSASILSRRLLRHGAVVSSLLGILMCTISWVAINRYLMGSDVMVGWTVTTGMALTTAVGMFLLGAATISLSFAHQGEVDPSRWLAYPLAFGFAAASLMIWRELIDRETMNLQRQTNAAAVALQLQLRGKLQMRLKAVSRFALRWGTLDSELYRRDGRRLLEDFDGILALNWITDDLRVGWLCSREDRLDLVGKPLPPGPRHAAVRKARQTGRFVFTPVLELLHGEPGFVGYVPTRNSQQELTGSVAAVFRLNSLLRPIAADRRHVGFHFSVFEQEQEIFSTARKKAPQQVVASTPLVIHGLRWRLNVWPTAETAAAAYSRVPDLALATGLLSALLVGVAVQLRQRAALRAREAERAARARRDSEQRFDLAVAASQDGIWEWRLGADGFYASPRYREILGYPQDDVLLSHQAWFARLPPDDVQRVNQAISDYFERAVPYDVVCRFLTFRDEWIWLRVRGQAAWDESGQPVRMAGSITDITNQREAEQQLLQYVQTIAESNRALAEMAEAAQAAATAKSAFLRTMSHELRTPLNSIIGFSTGLLRHAAEHELDDHQRDRVERIAASGQHLLQLVNNVLDIAKAESAGQACELEAVDLRELFDELAAMVEPMLLRRPAVRLRIAADAAVDAPTLDRTKLKQILLNLLANAVKFTDRGTIALTAQHGEEGWQFAVADTGIGVAPGDQRRIFENFEQVQIPGRKIEGSGLGLPICATLAAAMHGTITLTSRPGVGSRFTLHLPSSTTGPASPPAAGPAEGTRPPPDIPLTESSRRHVHFEQPLPQ
jgi:PAS domain S-box-containing protein